MVDFRSEYYVISIYGKTILQENREIPTHFCLWNKCDCTLEEVIVVTVQSTLGVISSAAITERVVLPAVFI